MIDRSASEQEKLKVAHNELQACERYHRTWRKEAATDWDFYDGHQWHKSDAEALENLGRPVLVFNVIKALCDQVLGSMEDNKLRARVAPVNPDEPEDQMLADVLNAIWERIRDDTDAEIAESMTFQAGTKIGRGETCIVVEDSPHHPMWVRICPENDEAREIRWDVAAVKPDRSDARYMIRDRWLTRDEFVSEYPEHRDLADELFLRGDGVSVDGVSHDSEWESATDEGDDLSEQHRVNDEWYVDRRRKRIRVVRMEYRCAVRKWFAVNRDTGDTIPLTEREADVLEDSVEFPELDVVERWGEDFYWLDWTRGHVLFDDVSQAPFEGFTCVSFVVYQDGKNKQPYGLVRTLRDPQRELNKRYSQAIWSYINQTQPGTDVETGAVDDQEEFEKASRRPGGTRWVRTGKIDAVRDRQQPQLPDSIQLSEIAINLMQRIAGVFLDKMVEPRGIPEAAATAELRHRQGLLFMLPVMRYFWLHKKRVLEKVIQAIVRSMPDDQIEAMLGNSARYQVAGRQVVNVETGQAVDLDRLEDLRWQVTLDTAPENSTQRVIDFRTLLEMHQAGIPVAPEVLLSLTSLSQDLKAKLRQFAEQQAQIAAQSADQQMQIALTQLDREHQLDVARLQMERGQLGEKTRHNRAQEAVALVQEFREYGVDFADLMVKADAEEKRLVAALMKQVEARQRARVQQQAGANGGVPQ